ncbi:DUF2860 domain-containing protein [Vibrio maerlii]|uniref:DUF2860 domain-containing protein n=1 Tax=Vibrio maerlii TaxID=2231648 RepID=UPI000E3E4B9A|nr:DUF2860 domain-containing protein [Vibrio maerlii]
MNKLSPILLSTLVLSLPSYAGLAPESGFSGNVTFLAGVSSDTNNLSVEQDAILTDLNSGADSEAKGIAGILGTVKYTFGEYLNHQVYAGTSREDIATGSLVFEIGYRYKFESGMIADFSTLPTIISGEVWADPHAEGVAREETDLSGNVVRFKLSNIAGSNFGLDIAAGESEVDDEHSAFDLNPEEQKLMVRERDYFYLKSDYRFVLEDGNGIVIPSINVISSDAEGDALAFKSLGGEVSYAKKIDRHGFVLTLGATARDYDAENPVFNKTREDKEFGAFLAYEYEDVLGYKDWAFISLLGAKTLQSNIDYYDLNQYIATVGLDYKF